MVSPCRQRRAPGAGGLQLCVTWSDVGRAMATKSSEEGSIVHKDTCPCPGANTHLFSEPTALPRAFLLGVVLLQLHNVENHRGGHFKTKVGHVWGSSCFLRLSCPCGSSHPRCFPGRCQVGLHAPWPSAAGLWLSH